MAGRLAGEYRLRFEERGAWLLLGDYYRHAILVRIVLPQSKTLLTAPTYSRTIFTP